MSEVRYSIQDRNFKDFGVYVSASRGLIDGLKRRQPKSYQWAEYHGLSVDLDRPRYEAREIVLDCFIVGKDWRTIQSGFTEFWQSFYTADTPRVIVEPFGYEGLAYCVYLQDEVKLEKRFRDGDMVGTFQLKLIEPNPVKVVLFHGGGRLKVGYTSEYDTEISFPNLEYEYGSGDVSLDVDMPAGYVIIMGNMEDIGRFETNASIVWGGRYLGYDFNGEDYFFEDFYVMEREITQMYPAPQPNPQPETPKPLPTDPEPKPNDPEPAIPQVDEYATMAEIQLDNGMTVVTTESSISVYWTPQSQSDYDGYTIKVNGSVYSRISRGNTGGASISNLDSDTEYEVEVEFTSGESVRSIGKFRARTLKRRNFLPAPKPKDIPAGAMRNYTPIGWRSSRYHGFSGTFKVNPDGTIPFGQQEGRNIEFESPLFDQDINLRVDGENIRVTVFIFDKGADYWNPVIQPGTTPTGIALGSDNTFQIGAKDKHQMIRVNCFCAEGGGYLKDIIITKEPTNGREAVSYNPELVYDIDRERNIFRRFTDRDLYEARYIGGELATRITGTPFYSMKLEAGKTFYYRVDVFSETGKDFGVQFNDTANAFYPVVKDQWTPIVIALNDSISKLTLIADVAEDRDNPYRLTPRPFWIKNEAVTEVPPSEIMNIVPRPKKVFTSLMDAIEARQEGEFSVGVNRFRKIPGKPTVNPGDFELLNGTLNDRKPRGFKPVYFDAHGWAFKHIDDNKNIWLTNLKKGTGYIPYAKFREMMQRAVQMPAGSGKVEKIRKPEMWAEILDSDITMVDGLPFAEGIRSLSGGKIILFVYGSAYVLEADLKTIHHFKHPDTMGGTVNGWLIDSYGDMAFIGGYFVGRSDLDGTRGHGRIVATFDAGKTWSTVFDVRRDGKEYGGYIPLGNAFHIHGCAYDPYWDRLWMVNGDSSESSTPGKIYWTDNYRDPVPTWNIMNYNFDKGRIYQKELKPAEGYEQWCSVFPIKDAVLFGADMNPTTLARMQRVGKESNNPRETMVYHHGSLTVVPVFTKFDEQSPIIVYNAQQGASPFQEPSIDISWNGYNFHRVWEDDFFPNGGDSQTKAYGFADGFVITNANTQRFDTPMIMAGMIEF